MKFEDIYSLLVEKVNSGEGSEKLLRLFDKMVRVENQLGIQGGDSRAIFNLFCPSKKASAHKGWAEKHGYTLTKEPVKPGEAKPEEKKPAEVKPEKKNPQRQKVLLELEVKSTSRKRWGVAKGEPRISHGEAPGTPEGCEMEKGGALYPFSRPGALQKV